MKELSIPVPAARDPKSMEMLRVWVAEQGLHCSVRVGVYEGSGRVSEEKAWGIMLADIARHVSVALESRSGLDPAKTVESINQSLQEELHRPSSAFKGGFK